MAEIFLAKMQGYSGFEKLLALKKIHPRYSSNQTFAQMLIHEAKLAACLQHFNVVQVHDLGEISEQVFIAMEYVRGRDLAAVLSNTYRRKERLPLNLSLCIATEFMTGLDYAHRMRATDGAPLGIIHRDISPQNILISYEGEVKVTDFGIARVLSEKDGFKLPGNLHGKFGYMSPEQVLGKEIDQRSDIFSAGVVLWEMLTGQRLFRGRDHKATIKMIVSHAIPPPSSINSEVPPSVDRICQKALARDRNARYQTTGALLGELSRAADELPRRAATRDLSVYMRRQFGAQTGSYATSISQTDSPHSSQSNHSGFESVSGLSELSGLSLAAGDRLPLGQVLMEQGSISVGELEIALAEQRARGGRIGELLVASGNISEDDLVRALSAQANKPSISEADLLALPAPNKLLSRFPREAAEATLIVPMSINEEQRSVALAVCDPYDDRAILETKVVLGVSDVDVFIAKRTAIRAVIQAWYGDEEVEEAEQGPIFEEPVEAEPVGPPVVLIADADTDAVEALVNRVREEDCEVFVATDGKKARDMCRQHLPTVAFLDASLPGIDGYNILLELRSKNADAAIFITSNRGDDFRQAKALELGADDFIVKPFSVEVTTSKIRREIQKRSSGRRVVAAPVQFDGVSGSLKDMTALDIVQSLEIGRKTANVVLQYEDGRSGEIGVQDGHIRGAVAGKLVGEEAFYALAPTGPGLFRIEYRTPSIPHNIAKPNTYLMIEAMRRIDESTVESEADVPLEAPVEMAQPPRPPPTPAPLPASVIGSSDSVPPVSAVGSSDSVPPVQTTPRPPPQPAPPLVAPEIPVSVPTNAPAMNLIDDLTIEPPVTTDATAANPLPKPETSDIPRESTPIGAQLGEALRRLTGDEQPPPRKTAREEGTGSYSRVDAKLARVPLRRIASIVGRAERPPPKKGD